jgi:hypothetical protein
MLTVIFKLIGLNLRSTKCKLSVTYLSHDFKRLKKDEFVNSFPKFVLFLYYRRFEELKNYSNELESNIANLLKIRAVSLKRQLIEFVRQDMDVDLHERLYNITLRHKMK